MAYSDEDLIRAALMDDPEDQEEVKSADKPEVASSDEAKKEPETDAVDKPEPKKTEDPKPNEDEEAEADDDIKEEDKVNDKAKVTRKQKREERKQSFIESIKAETEQKLSRREQLLQSDPNYKPVNYDEATELDVKVLEEDRNKYGNNKFSEGASTERYYADQEKFWTRTEYEGKLLESNPKYAFLDENNPDTFDADKAEELNGMYLELVGYDQTNKTVRRTDLSYERFVKNEVARIERWAGEEQAETVRNLASQASQGGIRPSGSSSSGLGKLKPGDISKMSDADFAKHEAEIDRQIMAQL